ncbi:MAG: transposase [Verrucomicrobia bacterium]|nr:transposase [Verrucomicrobiota bacterium]
MNFDDLGLGAQQVARLMIKARIPLDTNQIERGFRVPVVGRKNHYGSKSERGTVRDFG